MRWRSEWRSPPGQNSMTTQEKWGAASKSTKSVGRNGWSSTRRIRFSAAARSSFFFLATTRRSTTFIAYRHPWRPASAFASASASDRRRHKYTVPMSPPPMRRSSLKSRGPSGAASPDRCGRARGGEEEAGAADAAKERAADGEQSKERRDRLEHRGRLAALLAELRLELGAAVDDAVVSASDSRSSPAAGPDGATTSSIASTGPGLALFPTRTAATMAGRFYAAEVLLALEYLHMMGISPWWVAEPVEARSCSFVGTHEYVAPEVARGGPHGAAVDWWALGVFLYELLHGRTPFAGADNEATLRNIARRPLTFPSPATGSGSGSGAGDADARDLIERLLTKDPRQRLGSRRGAADVKAHPFFRGLNFALLRSSRPPVVPGASRSPLHRSQSCSAATASATATAARRRASKPPPPDSRFDLF